MGYANHIHHTRVHTTVDGDAYCPDILSDEWKEMSRVDNEADEHHAYGYSFIEYVRK